MKLTQDIKEKMNEEIKLQELNKKDAKAFRRQTIESIQEYSRNKTRIRLLEKLESRKKSDW